jgi:hypothetical protein
MSFKKAVEIADKTLTSDATLDELEEAADNLRALTPDSALAELVERKIEEITNDDRDKD